MLPISMFFTEMKNRSQTRELASYQGAFQRGLSDRTS
jgi:hypothetical protein